MRGKGLHTLLILPLMAFFSSCTYTFYPAECAYPVTGFMKKTAVITDSLVETSGLVTSDSVFISFNDSGGEPALYYFNRDGNLLQKTVIQHATNADWEDIASDGSYFYIADVGNNFGSRDTLTIYKVPFSKLGEQDILSMAGRISFEYDEPVDKNDRGLYSHDCEAMFVFDDSLNLFAKNWVSHGTRVYVLPAQPGHYKLKARMTYPVEALITGADIDPERSEVVLVGYRRFMPVLIRYSYLDDPAFIECGGKGRIYPRWLGTQTEGVCFGPGDRIYVTSEKRLYKQALYLAD